MMKDDSGWRIEGCDYIFRIRYSDILEYGEVSLDRLTPLALNEKRSTMGDDPAMDEREN